MSGSEWQHPTDIPGYFAPVHRALTEPILLAGAPRAIARQCTVGIAGGLYQRRQVDFVQQAHSW